MARAGVIPLPKLFFVPEVPGVAPLANGLSVSFEPGVFCDLRELVFAGVLVEKFTISIDRTGAAISVQIAGQ